MAKEEKEVERLQAEVTNILGLVSAAARNAIGAPIDLHGADMMSGPSPDSAALSLRLNDLRMELENAKVRLAKSRADAEDYRRQSVHEVARRHLIMEWMHSMQRIVWPTTDADAKLGRPNIRDAGGLPEGIRLAATAAQASQIMEFDDVAVVVEAFRWMSWCYFALAVLRGPSNTSSLKLLIELSRSIRVADDKIVKALASVLNRATQWKTKARKLISHWQQHQHLYQHQHQHQHQRSSLSSSSSSSSTSMVVQFTDCAKLNAIVLDGSCIPITTRVKTCLKRLHDAYLQQHPEAAATVSSAVEKAGPGRGRGRVSASAAAEAGEAPVAVLFETAEGGDPLQCDNSTDEERSSSSSSTASASLSLLSSDPMIAGRPMDPQSLMLLYRLTIHLPWIAVMLHDESRKNSTATAGGTGGASGDGEAQTTVPVTVMGETQQLEQQQQQQLSATPLSQLEALERSLGPRLKTYGRASPAPFPTKLWPQELPFRPVQFFGRGSSSSSSLSPLSSIPFSSSAFASTASAPVTTESARLLADDSDNVSCATAMRRSIAHTMTSPSPEDAPAKRQRLE